MSKVSLNVAPHFKKDGQERKPLYLDLTLNKDSPSDAHLAQANYDQVTQHPW